MIVACAYALFPVTGQGLIVTGHCLAARLLQPGMRENIRCATHRGWCHTLVSGLLQRSMVFALALVVLPHQVSHHNHSCGREKIFTCNHVQVCPMTASFP